MGTVNLLMSPDRRILIRTKIRITLNLRFAMSDPGSILRRLYKQHSAINNRLAAASEATIRTLASGA